MSRRVGIEEELLPVDVASGCPQAVATTGMRSLGARYPDGTGPGGALEEELEQEQIETDTRPCLTLGEGSSEVRRWRRQAAEAAAAATPRQRYRRMVEQFGVTAAERFERRRDVRDVVTEAVAVTTAGC